MPTPGIGDPYWYEWFVGLQYVIEMLNQDAGISSVTFQCSKYATIDDVVVEYNNGQHQMCYQVKHEIATSTENNLTFGKMLQSTQKKPCLFKALFTGWKSATEGGAHISTVLYTNRKLLNRRAGREYNGQKYSAYPVDQFISKIVEQLKNTPDFNEFKPTDATLDSQWSELWETVGKPDKKTFLSFLSSLSIEANQPRLSDMDTLLINKLAQYFQCDTNLASELFTRLLRGLRKWTTTERSSEKVFVEDVLTVLGAEEDSDSSHHRLAPPSPFFGSRKEFCDYLLQQFQETDKKLIFISGDPGSGKTSTISYLQSSENTFYLRYHTFKPISPDQRYYDSDHGLCSTEKLWGTLLTQLRQKYFGRLRELDIPVSNRLLSREAMRSNVIRLLAVAAQEAAAIGRKILICIDGIDHAARARDQVSFLPSLPTPDEIPTGVCFVVVGQPLDLYRDQYPNWMANNPDILYISMPKLCKDDIEQLIAERAPQLATEANRIALVIHEKTAGNNLSAAFVIEEIKAASSLDEAYEILKTTHISDNINQYYEHIWSYLKATLGKLMPGRVAPESYVACPLLLMNGRVNTRVLAQALQSGLSQTDWTIVLKHLHPLIVQTDVADEYTLFHNDFRVFLQSIMHQYPERYEEIAYILAKYLLENDEGLVSYALGIPLLKHANKIAEIPKYFNTGFVINALAEGISQTRLESYAHDAYQAACKTRDYDGYRNVYFALKTIYQHHMYYEYFDREYSCCDFPEIEQIDIAEIRVLPVSKENIDEYETVLSLCKKLYSSPLSDGQSRALNLYNMWFGHCTPLTFLTIFHDQSDADDVTLKTSDVGILLQSWGSLAACLGIPVNRIETDGSFIQYRAVFLWGDEYYSYCIENKKYDRALSAVQSGIVSSTCFTEKMEQLLYDGVAEKFLSILSKMPPNQEEPSEYLLALAMQIICCSDYFPPITEDSLSAVAKHIYDKSSFELILKAFLLGKLNATLDDDALIQKADAICSSIDGDKTSKQQTIHLARTASLLGKYYWNYDIPSERLQGYVIWFLSASMYRSFDYSKAHHFILFVILHCCSIHHFAKQLDFLNALHVQMFEHQHLAMYYKTHILDFFLQNNMLDPVREYIHALYGDNCQEISRMENKAEIHTRFCPYGMFVEPEMMRQFSAKLKWDVVGYLGYDEYALFSPLELYELIVQDDPSSWKDLGFALYQQSAIADESSNKAYFQISRSLSEAAARCSMNAYWELRTWNDEFRLNPDPIMHAIHGAVKCVTTKDDLITLWLLGCGLASWYLPEDHQQAKAIFDACQRRSEQLGIEVTKAIAILSPQWMDIIQRHNIPDHVQDDTAAYYSKREADIATITAMFEAEALPDTLDRLPIKDDYSSARIGYPLDYYEIALSRISQEEGTAQEYYVALLDKLSIYLQAHEWSSRDKYDLVIGQVLELLSDDAFWRFAICIGENLSEYNYQTASRNIQLLLKLHTQRNRCMLSQLLTEELASQHAWVTGNKHIEIPQEAQIDFSPATTPSSIQDACLNILLEQINSQNARKAEAAIYAITLLGQHAPSIMETIAENWNTYTPFQRDFLLHPISRWVIEGRCSKRLSRALESEYEKCNELSMKLRLHSLLLLLNVPNVTMEKVDCTANAKDHHLPSDGAELTECSFDRFINLIDHVLPETTIHGLRRYLMNSSPLRMLKKDPYIGSSDTSLPAISCVPGELFYQFEKDNLLPAIPLAKKKGYLLGSDDPFLATSIPNIDFSSTIFPLLKQEHSIDSTMFTSEELSRIAQASILPDETVVAACLWLPWKQNEGIEFNQVLKVRLEWARPDSDFDWCLGSYSTLIYEGDLVETSCSSYGNVSLFNKVGGNQMLYMGNCHLVPSSAWRRFFKCSPMKANPLIWLDHSGAPVLRFEYVAQPNRMLAQQAYIRQPILFRWICNKSWLDTALNTYGFQSYMVSETLPYPSTQEE